MTYIIKYHIYLIYIYIYPHDIPYIPMMPHDATMGWVRMRVITSLRRLTQSCSLVETGDVGCGYVAVGGFLIPK
jgi:hypothetical protein